MHPGAKNVLRDTYDWLQWNIFSEHQPIVTDRQTIQALRNAASEKRKKEEAKRANHAKAFEGVKPGGEPNLRALGDLGREILDMDTKIAEESTYERIGEAPELSEGTTWVVGHSSTLSQRIQVPAGMTITFYSELGKNSDQSGNTLVLETLGMSRAGFERSVTGPTEIFQMIFAPTKDDEMTGGRNKIVAGTPNAHIVGTGPFSGCEALCGSSEPEKCDHSPPCGGIIGAAMEKGIKDLRVIGCRGTRARGLADLNQRQNVDELIALAARASRFSMDDKEIPENLLKQIKDAWIALERTGSRIPDRLRHDDGTYKYKPGNPEFEADLMALRSRMLSKSHDADFEAAYLEAPRFAQGDLGMADKAGLLQRPRLKIIELRSEARMSATQIKSLLMSLSVALINAKKIEYASDFSSFSDKYYENVVVANQSIDAHITRLVDHVEQLLASICAVLDISIELDEFGEPLSDSDSTGPGVNVEARERPPQDALIEQEVMDTILRLTEEIVRASRGLLMVVDKDESIINKDNATKKCLMVMESVEGYHSALSAEMANLRKKSTRIIRLQQAIAKDNHRRTVHRRE